MSVLDLINSYDQALINRNAVANNREGYYHMVTHTKKIRNRVLGIVVSPSYENYSVREFKQAEYDSAVVLAQQAVDNYAAAIESSLNVLSVQIQTTNQETINLNNQSQGVINQIGTQTQINLNITTEVQTKEAQISTTLASATTEQRAFILYKLWADKQDANNAKTIESIKSLGFDANALAEYALSSDNDELFHLAMENNADCSKYSSSNISKELSVDNSKETECSIDVATTVVASNIKT